MQQPLQATYMIETTSNSVELPKAQNHQTVPSMVSLHEQISHPLSQKTWGMGPTTVYPGKQAVDILVQLPHSFLLDSHRPIDKKERVLGAVCWPWLPAGRQAGQARSMCRNDRRN